MVEDRRSVTESAHSVPDIIAAMRAWASSGEWWSVIPAACLTASARGQKVMPCP